MNYFVARNGQTYGPYSLDTVQKYLHEGSMSGADMARTDAMQNWAPLRQLLGAPAPPRAAYAQPVSGVNVPPSLPWVLVLLIAIFTSGLFITIWAFIQSTWVKTIDPASRATRDLVLAILMPIAGGIVGVVLLVMGGVSLNIDNLSVLGAGSIGMAMLVFLALAIGGLIFHVKAFFSIRDSMERYYNSVEPINLRLSGVMTLFFNVLYFQYHMTRIADWKRTGVLRP